MEENGGAAKEFDGKAFTQDERKRLMKMLETHERAAWLWSTLGIWVKWIGSIMAVLVATKVLIGEYLKGIFR